MAPGRAGAKVAAPARKGRKKETAFWDSDEDQDEAEVQLTVNDEFAKRFQHNKKREELQRLESKNPQLARKLQIQAAKEAGLVGGGSSESEEESSSDDEEDDGEHVDDAQMLKALQRIRSKDPSIYAPDAKLFDSPPDSGEDNDDEERQSSKASAGSNKQKPMYLKDVLAKQAMDEDGDEDERRAADEIPAASTRRAKAYNPEQENLRQQFLAAVEEAEEGGQEGPSAEDAGGLTLRKRARWRGRDDEQHAQLAEGLGSEAAGEALEDESFLMRFIMNKGWMEREEAEALGTDPKLEDDAEVDDDEDDEHLERADDFEHAYNFRFEEPEGYEIKTYPRRIEQTARKQESSRQRQRKAKQQRLQEEAAEREREVKRLKNLKKAQIQEQVSRIQKVAGPGMKEADIASELMRGNFDPEEWDHHMQKAFGDDYYNEQHGEDDERLSDILDDDLQDALQEAPRARKRGSALERSDLRTFAELQAEGAASQAEDLGVMARAGEGEDAEDSGPEADAEEDSDVEPEPEQEPQTSRAQVRKLLDEYYKLDAEDVVAGMPCRFRYRSVGSASYGMNVDTILKLSDSQLNQIVGMKKLAPYREERAAERPNYKMLQIHTAELGSEQKRARRGGAQKGKRWKGSQPGRRRQLVDRGSSSAGTGEDGHSDEGHPQAAKARQAEGKGEGGDGDKKQGGKREKLQKGVQLRGRERARGRAKAKQTPTPEEEKKRRDELRLASYAKPMLKRKAPGELGGSAAGDASRKKKKKRQAPDSSQKPESTVPPGLTKAQKKNFKRAQKRAQGKANAAEAAAAAE